MGCKNQFYGRQLVFKSTNYSNQLVLFSFMCECVFFLSFFPLFFLCCSFSLTHSLTNAYTHSLCIINTCPSFLHLGVQKRIWIVYDRFCKFSNLYNRKFNRLKPNTKKKEKNQILKAVFNMEMNWKCVPHFNFLIADIFI